jgi:hypothetical protein
MSSSNIVTAYPPRPLTANPLRAGAPDGEPALSPTAAKAAAVASGVFSRFSTAATQMTGEGLVEYGIFMDPKSMTKTPIFKPGCWGSFKKLVCTCVGGFENNRLKHMKNNIFPKLDGPVYIYDIKSKEGDSFLCLNDRDTGAPTRRNVKVAGGLFQRNVLYKLLPKEQSLVPATDWAEEHERSEIAEVLMLLQLVGAIAVDFVHAPSATQIGDIMDMPIETAENAGVMAVWGAYAGRLFKMFSRSAGSAARATLTAAAGGAAGSSLTGRVLFRSNERPTATLDAIINELGDEFYHVRTQPAVLNILRMRMGRGIQISSIFRFKHYSADSCWMEAMHELQVHNTPANIPMAEADVIDCGYRTGERRKRHETTFTVIFPDVKDGIDKRQGGGDVVADAPEGFKAGAWHPLSTISKLDMPTMHTSGPSAGSGDSAKAKGGSKGAKHDASEAPSKKDGGGGIIGILRRATGMAGGKAEAEAGDEDDTW